MIHRLKIPAFMYLGLDRGFRNFHILSGPKDVRGGDDILFQLWDPMTGRLGAAFVVSGVGVIVEGEEWGLPPGVRVIQLIQPLMTPQLKAQLDRMATRAREEAGKEPPADIEVKA